MLCNLLTESLWLWLVKFALNRGRNFWVFHGRPQACVREVVVPLENAKVRSFGHSISTFWFALKEPYRCHRTRFAGQNITKCICGRGSAPDPSRGAYSAPLDPLAGFNGRARWMGEEEMGREGKNGREKGDRKEGGLCLLQKFLRAPMFLHTICETVLRYFSCSLLSRLTSLLRLLFYRLHRD